MTEGWNPPLGDPTTDAWFPKPLPRDALKQAFYERCLGAEQLLLLRAALERRMNIQNFDSGPGFEDLVRDELSRILPDRYSVHPGVVSNSDGLSAGECDVVLYNSTWFSAIKAGATEASRRWHYPVEGVYGVLEVKQSLTDDVLEKGLQKLVQFSRLEGRNPPSRTRFVENRSSLMPDEPVRPYTALVAGGLGEKQDLEELAHRFIAINGQLPREHIVNALAVLGQGFICWGFQDEDDDRPQVAVHSNIDDHLSLFPLFVRAEGEDDTRFSAFYELVTNMMGHLTSTVLLAAGMGALYGAPQRAARPNGDEWNMVPNS